MLGFSLRNVSIVAWGWRAALVAVLVLLVATSRLRWRARILRWTARALCVPLVLAIAGATINAHYDYFPTIGALLGRTAADQISGSGLQRLEHSYLRVLRPVYRTVSGRRRAAPVPIPAHGVVVAFSMPGIVSHFRPRTGQVYLPPIWFARPRPRLPVIELLHGAPGSPADWTRGGLADVTADAYARAHHGFAPILVMPDVNGGGWWSDSECVDGPLGNAETYLTVDVRNAVVRAFGARRDGGSWAVAGLSEGGSCALQMALRHPDLFGGVGDFSGDDHPWVSGGPRRLFWGASYGQRFRAERSYDPRVLLANWRGGNPPALVFAAGRSDRLLPKIERLYLAARRRHIVAVFHTYPGGHTFHLWSVCLARNFAWIVQHLEEPHAMRVVTLSPAAFVRPSRPQHA